nr:hypothetical protein BaRGS_017183 [Batillaria attramentaria]
MIIVVDVAIIIIVVDVAMIIVIVGVALIVIIVDVAIMIIIVGVALIVIIVDVAIVIIAVDVAIIIIVVDVAIIIVIVDVVVKMMMVMTMTVMTIMAMTMMTTCNPVIAWSQTGHKDDAWTKAQITFDTASPARVADGEWAPWGSCSVTCGGGQRVRCLVCDTTPSGGQSSTCDGSYKETEDCGTQACGTTSDTDEVGIIAGAVVGCLLIVAVTTIVIVWIMRKKSFGSSKRSDSSTELGQMSTRSISYMGYENPDDIRTQGLSTSGRAGMVTVPAQIGADYDDVNQTEGRDVDTSDYDKLEMYENKKEITNVYTSLDHGMDGAKRSYGFQDTLRDRHY